MFAPQIYWYMQQDGEGIPPQPIPSALADDEGSLLISDTGSQLVTDS